MMILYGKNPLILGLYNYFKRPNMHKFIELMSNDDTRTVCSLANIGFEAFLIRKSHMAITT